MPHQPKLNSPICNYPRLTNLSDHLTKVHGINGQERKCLLAKARFAVLCTQPDPQGGGGNTSIFLTKMLVRVQISTTQKLE